MPPGEFIRRGIGINGAWKVDIIALLQILGVHHTSQTQCHGGWNWKRKLRKSQKLCSLFFWWIWSNRIYSLNFLISCLLPKLHSLQPWCFPEFPIIPRPGVWGWPQMPIFQSRLPKQLVTIWDTHVGIGASLWIDRQMDRQTWKLK